jgi:hypothetical protein
MVQNSIPLLNRAIQELKRCVKKGAKGVGELGRNKIT